MPLPDSVGALHVRLQMGDGRLHHFRALQDERQLHLRRRTTRRLFASGQQHVVDDAQSGFLPSACQVRLQSLGLAIDDAPLQTFHQRQPGQFVGAVGGDALGVGEDLQEMSQRVVDQTSVVVVAAPVVNQVHGGVAFAHR